MTSSLSTQPGPNAPGASSHATAGGTRFDRTYTRIDFRRITTDPPAVFFGAILPAFMYIVFGATLTGKSELWGVGDVAMGIMISMAAYGCVTATVGIGGRVAVERFQGWDRQLRLTPMTDATYLITKVVEALLFSLIPISLIYIIGALTGASGPASAWILSTLVVIFGAIPFGMYGLSFGLAFRSEVALSAAGGSLVLFAFAGNMFMPLSGGWLMFARFTPLYGYNALARYPSTRGILASASGPQVHESVWIGVVNLAAWTLILFVIAMALLRRSRGRL